MRGPTVWALLVGLAGVPAQPATAQLAPDRAAILATVERLFTGFRSQDTAMMASAFDPAATTVAVSYRDGRSTVSGRLSRATWPGIVAASDGPDERLLAAEVWQDGDVAVVWAPYELRRAGAMVHCGFDALDLIRRDGRWVIVAAGYTARPDGCPAVREAAAAGEPLPAPAAADRAAVLDAVGAFFAALRTRDPAALAASLTSRANWNTARYRDGGVILSRRPAAEDVATLRAESEPLIEQLIDAVVRVDGDLALVWGPYRFSVGDRLSHCGHDGFRLVREDGRWRLDGGIYTVRPDGCPSLLSPAQVDSLPSRGPDTVIAYGPEARQTAELRLPAGRGPFPVAVVVHGGCWQRRFASARNTAALADALRSEGFATWNVEYRTADETGGGWPGTFLDVSDATDFLRTLVGHVPIDTTRVVAVGHSAGGHLVLWLAGRGRVAAQSAIRRPTPLAITGVVALGPVMDLGEAAERVGGICGQGATMVVGGTPTEVPERHAAAAPIEMLPLGVPQAILMGELDGIMPVVPREAYVRKARRLGDQVDLIVVPNAGHFEVIAPPSAAWATVRDAIRRLSQRR